MDDRLPPQDLNAEMALLGAILNAPHTQVSWTFDDVLSVVKGGAFVDEDHRKIFVALYDMNREGIPVDIVTLRKRLQGSPNSGSWEPLLIGLAESVPDAGNALHYAAIVRECHTRRQAIRKAHEMLNHLNNPSFDVSHIPNLMEQFRFNHGDGGGKGRKLVYQMGSDVEIKPVSWLWRNRVPAGMLSIFTGLPDCGKSSVCIDMAARITNGRAWPDRMGEPNEVGDVVYVTGEDPIDRVLKPRFIAAGGDDSRIAFASGIIDNGVNGMISLNADMAEIRGLVETLPNTRMIVFDPLVSFMGKGDSYKDSEVRKVLSPLAKLAEDTGVAIIAVIHFKKGVGGIAIDKIGGSRGFGAAARSAWAFVRENVEGGNDISKMLHAKSNIGRRMKGLAFELGHRVEVLNDSQVDDPEDKYAPCIHWRQGDINDDINDVLAAEQNGQDRSDRDDASEWLKDILSDGRLPVNDIKKMAGQACHSWATIRRAKDEVGVRIVRDGFGKGSVSYWELGSSTIDAHPSTIDAHYKKVSMYGEGEQVWDRAQLEGVNTEGVSKYEAPIDAHLSHRCSPFEGEQVCDDGEQVCSEAKSNGRPPALDAFNG